MTGENPPASNEELESPEQIKEDPVALRKQIEVLLGQLNVVTKQRDAAIKLLNRRNQELFNDHSGM